jgi:hypothetical protein
MFDVLINTVTQLAKGCFKGTRTSTSPIVMALAPPANNAGVPIPAIAANPPSLSDITNIKNYVERLTQSKGKCLLPDLMNLNETD